jgi:hypothetical protein
MTFLFQVEPDQVGLFRVVLGDEDPRWHRHQSMTLQHEDPMKNSDLTESSSDPDSPRTTLRTWNRFNVHRP